MSQVRANLRKQWQSLLIAMGIVIGIVVGCGGGGGGGGAQSASSGSGSTASQPSNSAVSSTVSGGNNIILSVQRAARAARKLPSNTVRVRATIVGTNISAVADFGPDVLAVTLELFAPLGPQTVRIDALDADGNVVASGELQVTVGSGPSTPVTVPVDSLVASSPTPTPSPSASPSPSPSASPSASPSPALRFGVQPPSPVLAKMPFSVTVEAFDPSTNQVLSSFNGPVTLTLATNPGGDTISPTTVNAVNGVATFHSHVIINPGSGYQFQASTPGLTSGLSNAFAVVMAALKFTAQPLATQPLNANMQPQSSGIQVAVVDTSGAVITSVNGLGISMTVTPNPNGTALLGATTVATVNGVATFSNLQMNATGLGFMLVASASGSLSQTSSSFNVGPAVSPGTVFIVTETGGRNGVHRLAGYDLNTLVAVAPPSVITGYVPVAISVWPGNASGPPAVLVLGDDNTLHFFSATTLQELTGTALTLPNSIGSPSLQPSTPQLIKKDPLRDVFYITAQNPTGDLIDIVDLSNGPAGAVQWPPASGLNGSHGIGVDPATTPTFVMTQGNFGLQGDTINPGPPVSLSNSGSGSTNLPGNDSYLDINYVGGNALALNTYGNISYGPSDESLTWFGANGSPSGSTSINSFGGNPSNDVRNDVRFFQNVSGTPTSTATALVCNATSNLLEMVSVQFTAGAGAPLSTPRPQFGLGITTVSITSAVTDSNGVVKSPQRLALSMSMGTFVQAFSTSSTTQLVPVIDLLTGGHPTVYGTIDLGAGNLSTSTAVLQTTETITGQ